MGHPGHRTARGGIGHPHGQRGGNRRNIHADRPPGKKNQQPGTRTRGAAYRTAQHSPRAADNSHHGASQQRMRRHRHPPPMHDPAAPHAKPQGQRRTTIKVAACHGGDPHQHPTESSADLDSSHTKGATRCEVAAEPQAQNPEASPEGDINRRMDNRRGAREVHARWTGRPAIHDGPNRPPPAEQPSAGHIATSASHGARQEHSSQSVNAHAHAGQRHPSQGLRAVMAPRHRSRRALGGRLAVLLPPF